MMCKNTIQEYNSERPCWLPVNPNSPFSFCSRCDFEKVEQILQNPETLEKHWKHPQFLSLLRKKEHQDTLLNALSFLCKTNATFFPALLSGLQTDCFQSSLSRLTYTHSVPSQRCCLYQYALLNRNTMRLLTYTEFPWNCWACLTKTLRNKNTIYYRAYANGVIRNSLRDPQLHRDEVLDCMVSLKLLGKNHAVRLLFERYRALVKNEEAAKELLQEFLSQPCMITSLFLRDIETIDFIPSAWKPESFVLDTQKKALKFVKTYNYVFKEDLMIKTWAPHRLFAWCFDIEELKDFEPI